MAHQSEVQSAVNADEVLLRYLYADGTVQAAMPMHVVAEDTERAVAWLAPGTPIMYWSTTDGRDPRSLPLEERFTGGLGTAPRSWVGNGVLRVIPLAQPFQVVHFWGDDGEFAGWYVNLESEKRKVGSRIDTVDWHLDLWISPDRTVTWKDEDEAAEAVRQGLLLPEHLELAYRTGHDIIGRFDSWLDEIGDWRDFRPEPDWCVPVLPPDWPDLGMDVLVRKTRLSQNDGEPG